MCDQSNLSHNPDLDPGLKPNPKPPPDIPTQVLWVVLAAFVEKNLPQDGLLVYIHSLEECCGHLRGVRVGVGSIWRVGLDSH